MTDDDDVTGEPPHYGLYEGTVMVNVDPEQRGRLMVTVPAVLSLIPSSWAEPCVPLAGPTGPPMGTYFVPPIGAGVWVTFAGGDVNRPIWVGCRFGIATDVPPMAKLGLPVSPSIVLQTASQHAFAISDLPGPTGGIILKSATGAMIIVNDTGIYLSNGKGATITMVGTAIDFNAGALTVLK